MRSRFVQSRRAHERDAFSLVEVTLALGIAAFCLLVIFGLLPTALNSTRDTIHQTAAAGLATNLAADLRSTAVTSTASPLYGLVVQGGTYLAHTNVVYLQEDGSTNSAPTGNGASPVYRATVVVTSPATTMARAASTAWIQITWPATVNPATQTPSGTYETVVGLDRN